jgi:hypothetical protein
VKNVTKEQCTFGDLFVSSLKHSEKSSREPPGMLGKNNDPQAVLQKFLLVNLK